MHSHWRDCQEWHALGLPFSSTSNEALKLFDAALTQYVGWYDDDSVGGLDGALGKMMAADSEFVMGHVIKTGLILMGTGQSPRLDAYLRQSLSNLSKLCQSQGTSAWERLHIGALNLCAEGNFDRACDVWERILVDHPTDMLAIKFAHDAYFYLAHQARMRDSIARILTLWKASTPLYGYLMGMYSFGLVETNLFAQAEKVAKKGLELNPRDAWSTHSLAHVMEMEGRQNEGLDLMGTTVREWSSCGMLASHAYWHWALYHIEKGDYDSAMGIFDREIRPRALKSGAMLDIVDGTSLLYRLQLEGVDVKSRWADMFETCRTHIDDHILAFNDIHILLSCIGARETQTVRQMMDSIEEYIRNARGTNRDVTNQVCRDVMKAFIAYEEGDFAGAVDLLNPLRYDVIKLGGSNAQRDLFSLFLINAALKSREQTHHRLARHLLNERKALKENAPMTDRLIARALANHAD